MPTQSLNRIALWMSASLNSHHQAAFTLSFSMSVAGRIIASNAVSKGDFQREALSGTAPISSFWPRQEIFLSFINPGEKAHSCFIPQRLVQDCPAVIQSSALASTVLCLWTMIILPGVYVLALRLKTQLFPAISLPNLLRKNWLLSGTAILRLDSLYVK